MTTITIKPYNKCKTENFREFTETEFDDYRIKCVDPTCDQDDVMLDEQDKSIHHEVITGRCRPYFDFEHDFDDEETMQKNRTSLLLEAFNAIKCLFRNKKDDKKVSEVILGDSSGYSEGKNKWRVSGRFFVRGAGYFRKPEHLKEIAEKLKLNMPAFDTGVYYTNKTMRNFYCHKEGDDRVLRRAQIEKGKLFVLDETKTEESVNETWRDWLVTDIFQRGGKETKCLSPEEKDEKPEEEHEEHEGTLSIAEIREVLHRLSIERASNRNYRRPVVTVLARIAARQDTDLLELAHEFGMKAGDEYEADKIEGAYNNPDRTIKATWATIQKWADYDSGAINRDWVIDAQPEMFDIEPANELFKKVRTGNDLGAFTKALVLYMNRYFVLIRAGTKPLIIEQVVRFEDGKKEKGIDFKSVKGLETEFINKSFTWNDGLASSGNKVPSKDAKKGLEHTTSAFSIWLKHPLRHEKDRVIFNPRVDEDAKYHDARSYNLYTGLAITREMCKDAPKLADDAPILHHIRHRWCHDNEKLFTHVMSLFARLVQQPWNMWKVMLVLKSFEGSGKGLIIEQLVAVIGEKYIARPTSPKQVLGNFNAALVGKLIYLLDEMVWGGDKQADGVLKKLVTEKWMTIELKGIDPTKVQNCGNLIVPSNEDWIVPVSKKGRRVQALEPSEELAGKKTAATRKIIAEIVATDPNSWARYLYELDISAFDPTEIISTDLLRDQKVQSMDPLHQICFQILCKGVIKRNGVKYQVAEKRFKCDDFYESSGGAALKFMTETKFWKTLKVLWPSITRERIMVDKQREWYVTFPPITVMRDEFRALYNDEEWPFEETEEVDDADDDEADQ